MSKVKSVKKGEVATLLTLGLVLVGGLIVFGLSLLTNQNKITINTRATEGCNPPNPSKAICFCKNGTVTVYATSGARKANCMEAPPENYADASAYGTKNWAYCSDKGTGFEGTCEGGNEGGEEGGEEGTETEECPKPKTTCAEVVQFGPSDVIFSSDSENIYYEGKNCAGDKVGDLSDLRDRCESLVSGDCTEVKCSLILGPENPGADFGNKSVYIKSGETDTYYKKGCIQEVLLQTCWPEAERTCDPVNCSDLQGSDWSGTVYRWSDMPTKYYKTGTCLVSADLNTDCTNSQTEETDDTIQFEVRENGAEGVLLRDLFCDNTSIAYNGSSSEISAAVEMCVNVFHYNRNCLRIVASDRGFPSKPRLYCCSDQFDCEQ